jgi:hypothetical protein
MKPCSIQTSYLLKTQFNWDNSYYFFDKYFSAASEITDIPLKS